MTNKILEKHGVITSGAGSARVVLDWESGIVYSYVNPESITALFQKGQGWIMRKHPYYSPGHWGSGSSGDRDGSGLLDSTKRVLRAISAKTLELNTADFLTQEEIDNHNRTVAKMEEISKSSHLKSSCADGVRSLSLPRYIKTELINDSKTARGFDPIKEYFSYKKGLEVFLSNKGKKTQFKDFSFSVNKISQGKVTVAFRDTLNNVWLNSQVISLSNFESDFMGKQSIVQKEVRKIAKYSIPFNVLESAKLSLAETKVLEQGPESDHEIMESRHSSLEQRHFTGALLLENKGRKFLMDIDRLEITHKLFNVFFVEVEKSVKTIAEAYESMKPKEVKEAESKDVEVLRQGEWFFIATDRTIEISEDNNHSYQLDKNDEDAKKQRIERRAVSHGKGRPNNLSMPFGFKNQAEIEGLVCGTVTHQGREHADLDLGITAKNPAPRDKNGYQTKNEQVFTYKLWKIVGNTTVSNFTITGDVD